MTHLPMGTVLDGRYQVVRLIGSGGMGEVYQVADQHLGQACAVKVLRPGKGRFRELARALRQEASLCSRLDHDNIVKIYGSGEFRLSAAHPRQPYMIMEYLEGLDLRSLVEDGQSLTPAQTLRVLSQVASALDYSHGRVDSNGRKTPIVHQDLKPDNLFLARTARGECLKILDYGVAKALSTSQNISETARGSALFMAPEQVLAQPLGPQTDIWSFGLLAFFLLSGRHYWLRAYQNRPAVALLPEITAREHLEPTKRLLYRDGLKPPWPESFDEWFLTCVAYDPRKRYPSAGVAHSVLESVFHGYRRSPPSRIPPPGRQPEAETEPVASVRRNFWGK